MEFDSPIFKRLAANDTSIAPGHQGGTLMIIFLFNALSPFLQSYLGDSKVMKMMLTAFLGIGILVSQANAASLSDVDAEHVLEAGWEEYGIFFGFLGRVTVYPKNDPNRAMLIYEDLEKVYIPLAQEGLINIAGAFHQGNSWDDVLRQIKNGSVTDLQIEITPEGKKKDTDGGGYIFKFPIGHQKVDKIVANDEVKKDLETYRVIKVKYHIDIDPVAKRIMKECGHIISNEQKGMVLLKYDEFSAVWKFFTEDAANADDEFCTSLVETKLNSK